MGSWKSEGRLQDPMDRCNVNGDWRKCQTCVAALALVLNTRSALAGAYTRYCVCQQTRTSNNLAQRSVCTERLTQVGDIHTTLACQVGLA